MTAFLFRGAKPKAAEKSWRRTLRETSEAKPVLGQTHTNRDRGWSARVRKSEEYGNGGHSFASPLESGDGVGAPAEAPPLILIVMAPQPSPVAVTGTRPCLRPLGFADRVWCCRGVCLRDAA